MFLLEVHFFDKDFHRVAEFVCLTMVETENLIVVLVKLVEVILHFFKTDQAFTLADVNGNEKSPF